MKEKDIRPTDLVIENAKLHKLDLKKIFSFENKFITVPCPACESKNYQIIFKKQGFLFVKCSECETVFINPRPTPSILYNFYTNSKSIAHWNDKIFPASESIRRKKIFAPRTKMIIQICKKYHVKNNVLIDVGAGFGTFCEEIKKYKFFKEVIAIEPSQNLAETCRKKGLSTIEKPVEKVHLKNANVITNFELIEHLYSPKDFLLSCAKILPSGGLFILTTPNIKGFDLQILGKISDNIGGPDHLNYFHPQSLTRLLETCGFTVIETITPGKLDVEIVRKKVLSNNFSLKDNPFLNLVLIERWLELGQKFQTFLAKSLLSSHLWIVARKN